MTMELQPALEQCSGLLLGTSSMGGY